MRADARADAWALRQALHKLLRNACKSLPQGGAAEVNPQQRTTPQAGLQHGVALREHGIGMTPAQPQRVGERFYRADATGSIPGTGLDIGLVQQIVRRPGPLSPA